MGVMFSSFLTASGVTGTIADGQTITISGSGFGTKPDPASRGTAKPILVWKGNDNSLLPNSTLGDVSAFDTGLLGSIETNITAPNSNFSYKAELGSDIAPGEGYTLRLVVGDWDTFYVFRRELFTKHGIPAELLRTRTTNTSEEVALISAGDWGRSQAAGNKTGKVCGIGFGSDDTTIFWSSTEGEIAAAGNPATNFTPSGVNDDIDIYATQAEAESGSGTIIVTVTTNEGLGTPFRTFNNKNVRFSAPALKPNAYIQNPYINRNGTSFVGIAHVELTGSSAFSSAGWTNNDEVIRPVNDWYVNEWTWKWGTVDTADGEMLFYLDGVCAFTTSDKKFITSSTTNPDKFNLIAHMGNDNDFTKGTDAYVDYLYVDDSFNRVMCAASTTLNLDSTVSTTGFDLQPWPIVAWADGEIQCVVQQGDHATLAGKTILAVDSTDTVVFSGLIS